MGRKVHAKSHLPPDPRATDGGEERDASGLYHKRLRSWKRSRTEMKTNPAPVTAAVNRDDGVSPRRSTIYTYPIHFDSDRQCILATTQHSESVTTDSAFYCPSVSATIVETPADLNNNHVTKRHLTPSCRSLSSWSSATKTLEILNDPNDESDQLPHEPPAINPRQFSTSDSVVTDDHLLNSSLPIESDTIDINQLDRPEPLSLARHNEPSIQNSDSMEVAVKMVQPIVDIIFHAFEDQLKQAKTNAVHSSLSHASSTALLLPCLPSVSSTQPVVLHAVNFNIQLTTKQNSLEKQTFTEQYFSNPALNEHAHPLSFPFTEFKRKMVSSVPSDSSFITTNDYQRRKRRLKRLAQVAVFGVSVLCAYLLL